MALTEARMAAADDHEGMEVMARARAGARAGRLLALALALLPAFAPGGAAAAEPAMPVPVSAVAAGPIGGPAGAGPDRVAPGADPARPVMLAPAMHAPDGGAPRRLAQAVPAPTPAPATAPAPAAGTFVLGEPVPGGAPLATPMPGRVLGPGRAVPAAVPVGPLAPPPPAVAPEFAGATAWSGAEMAPVRLIAAAPAVAPGATALRLGLEFRLDDGWKIYWRSPGSSGVAPQLDWTESRNLAGAPVIAWPAPERFLIFGITAYGYGRAVVLPVTAPLAEAGAATRLRLRLDYLICREVCVPGEAVLALDLPAAAPGAGAVPPGEGAHRIEQGQGRVPVPAAAAGVTIESVRLARGRQGAAMEVLARADMPFSAPDLFLEELGAIDLPAAPRVSLAEGGRLARFDFALPASAAAAAEPGRRLGLVITDQALAVEAAAEIEAAPAGGGLGLAAAILLALLGGVILNLMPCVLPVLSLKLLGVVGAGGAAPARVRAGFLASAAGILSAFLLLGAVLAGLKGAGAAIGWGIQFQEPWFLAAMATLVTLFAANLWGFFHITLPGWIGAMAVPAEPGAVTRRPSLAGDFAAGALATLLATPCSAPFVGTAVGFALASGTATILAIFAALGIGLAAPWLLVAAFPRLAARLPRPGAWMIWLRRVLGLVLLGTAAWLVWVLEGTAGESAALAVAVMLAAVLVVLWLARRTQAGLALAAAASVLAAMLLPGLLAGTGGGIGLRRSATVTIDDIPWRPFAPAEAERMARAGRLVLVDITADWCITCRVNKAMVLSRGAVRARLDGPEADVVAMQGDWTRPDARIAAYLQSFGRFGIPFNAVYGPGAPTGIALPELLTEGAVLAALAEAAGRSP